MPRRSALPDVPLIDALPGTIEDRLATLGGCGLSEARLLLRTPAELSEGQRYRFRLAYALSSASQWVAVDEFTATLDRTLAKVVAFNVRKLVSRTGVGVLAATTHDDIVEDLQPDMWVRCGDGWIEAERRSWKRQPISFANELWLSDGTGADWPHFARWHYRGHDLAFTRRVILLWHDREPVGICVFATPAASLSARTRFFGLHESAFARRARGDERTTLALAARRVAPDLSRRRHRVRVRAPRVRTVPGRLDRNAFGDGPRQSILRACRVHARRRRSAAPSAHASAPESRNMPGNRGASRPRRVQRATSATRCITCSITASARSSPPLHGGLRGAAGYSPNSDSVSFPHPLTEPNHDHRDREEAQPGIPRVPRPVHHLRHPAHHRDAVPALRLLGRP